MSYNNLESVSRVPVLNVWSERYRILSTLLGEKPEGGVSFLRLLLRAFFLAKMGGFYEHNKS